MEARGHSTDSNILLQYNQSTTLLSKNGRSFEGKKSKPIYNHYSLVTDKINQKDLEILCKSTGEILPHYH